MKQQRQGGFLLAKIRQVGERLFVRKLKDHDIDINPAQGRIMFALWQKDGISIQELGKRTQLSKSTLTSMLDRLEDSGYIRREFSREDRRVILIRRTRKDRDLEKKYTDVSREMTRLYYRGFTAGQIDRFEADLKRILDNLIDCESE